MWSQLRCCKSTHRNHLIFCRLVFQVKRHKRQTSGTRTHTHTQGKQTTTTTKHNNNTTTHTFLSLRWNATRGKPVGLLITSNKPVLSKPCCVVRWCFGVLVWLRKGRVRGIVEAQPEVLFLSGLRLFSFNGTNITSTTTHILKTHLSQYLHHIVH